MKIPYGLMKDTAGNYAINENEADTVRFIFHLYLSGYSLGKIVCHLDARGIASPSGNTQWGRAAIDKMLANKKHIPIVGMKDYLAAQFEKHERSNVDEENGARKACVLLLGISAYYQSDCSPKGKRICDR